MSHHGRYYLKECGNDCGYMFVAWSNSSSICSKCGGHKNQPRVCKTGGGKTDFAVLVDLAQNVVARMAERLNEHGR